MVPAGQPPPSWQQQQEAFDNYLCLIYGPALLVCGVPPPAPALTQPLPSFWGSYTTYLPCLPPLPGHAFSNRVPAVEHRDPHSGEKDLECMHAAQSCLQSREGWGLH